MRMKWSLEEEQQDEGADVQGRAQTDPPRRQARKGFRTRRLLMQAEKLTAEALRPYQRGVPAGVQATSRSEHLRAVCARLTPDLPTSLGPTPLALSDR